MRQGGSTDGLPTARSPHPRPLAWHLKPSHLRPCALARGGAYRSPPPRRFCAQAVAAAHAWLWRSSDGREEAKRGNRFGVAPPYELTNFALIPCPCIRIFSANSALSALSPRLLCCPPGRRPGSACRAVCPRALRNYSRVTPSDLHRAYLSICFLAVGLTSSETDFPFVLLLYLFCSSSSDSCRYDRCTHAVEQPKVSCKDDGPLFQFSCPPHSHFILHSPFAQLLAYWRLELKLREANDSLLAKTEDCKTLEEYRQRLEQEMSDLTEKLFEEAHEMVNAEKASRAAAEKRYAEAKHKVDVSVPMVGGAECCDKKSSHPSSNPGPGGGSRGLEDGGGTRHGQCTQAIGRCDVQLTDYAVACGRRKWGCRQHGQQRQLQAAVALCAAEAMGWLAAPPQLGVHQLAPQLIACHGRIRTEGARCHPE